MTMHCLPTPGLKGWIEHQRAAAIARGGRAFTAAEVIAESRRYKAEVNRPILARGEILNPVTGEVVTDCLSLSKAVNCLQERYGIDTTVRTLVAELAREGLTERRLAWRMVPLVKDLTLKKPEYRHEAVASRAATCDGLLISIDYGHSHERWVRTLVTREGLAVIARRLKAPEETVKKPKVRDTVRALLAEGRTQTEIVRLTGCSKQVVSYHAKSVSNV